MFGSMAGNITGILYFTIFQLIGIGISFRILKTESTGYKVLLGSVLGSFSLQWLPAVVSFFCGFNRLSHIIGLIMFFLVLPAFLFTGRQKASVPAAAVSAGAIKGLFREHKILFILLPTFIYYIIIVLTHTIPMTDGSIYTGQSTYGDLNMHLGFITSIANQGTFPPDYSILPGTRLSYPFLNDSISSSLYLFGASLRIAAILPMLTAILQVFFGFYFIAVRWLKNKTKAIIAWILFFFNGGFGFLYFIDGIFSNPENFTRIFTQFYQTPTNLIEQNVRWVNVIVDMLVPQRATLFGWAVLFPLISLIYTAIYSGKKKYFILAGILAGGLPMIHTHSFLALGMICAVWLLAEVYRMAGRAKDQEGTNRICRWLIPAGLLAMSGIQLILALAHINNEAFLITIPVTGIIIFIFILLYYVIKAVKSGFTKKLLSTWGVFLILVMALALPQLFTWTFQQAGGDGFVRGNFNWANDMDQYIWFYLKNIGITAILAVPAFLYCKRKDLWTAAPVFLIWPVCELVVFQPNTYDNNKLLYVAFLFICCITADYMVERYQLIKQGTGKTLLVIGVITCSILSAVLTMGREYVSKYQLYGENQIKICEYIEENTAPDAVIMTDTRHNNAIASLTGRNIVCGAGTFLYYHGLNYYDREQNLKLMYEQPGETQDLYSRYQVDYILIGPDERSSYPELDEAYFINNYPCAASYGDTALYSVKAVN